MKILTVALNPCIDKTYFVPGFERGRIYRPEGEDTTAGGKGINVARALKSFDVEAIALGFQCGKNGAWLADNIAAEGISHRLIAATGENRICISIIDPLRDEQTEINETGPSLSQTDQATLISAYRELLPCASAVILSGSIPPGIAHTLYAKMIALAQAEHGIPVLLDASGEPLRSGASAHPRWLKINAAEAEMLGAKGEPWETRPQELRELCGTQTAIVTRGAAGATLASEDGGWSARPPSIQTIDPRGSGDSFAAAFVWASLNGYNEEESLRWGTAAGTANASSRGPGSFRRQDVEELFGRVEAKRLN